MGLREGVYKGSHPPRLPASRPLGRAFVKNTIPRMVKLGKDL